jgi:hypothetical protein
MFKYRQHVQQLQLMEEKEKMAVQLFNSGLAQVGDRRPFSFSFITDAALTQRSEVSCSPLSGMTRVG